MLIEAYSPPAVAGPLPMRALRAASTVPPAYHRSGEEGQHRALARKLALLTKHPTFSSTPYVVHVDRISGPVSATFPEFGDKDTDEDDLSGFEFASTTPIQVRLAQVEYNAATQRITGSICVRGRDGMPADAPLTIVARFIANGGENPCCVESEAQLLFSAMGMSAMQDDVYGFSLRTRHHGVLSQPGQALEIVAVARCGGAVVAVGEDIVKCTAALRSPLLY